MSGMRCPACGSALITMSGGEARCGLCRSDWRVENERTASKSPFINALQDLYQNIEKQQAVIVNHAHRLGIDPYEMQYKDGKFALTDILAAKAQVLSAIVNISEA